MYLAQAINFSVCICGVQYTELVQCTRYTVQRDLEAKKGPT